MVACKSSKRREYCIMMKDKVYTTSGRVRKISLIASSCMLLALSGCTGTGSQPDARETTESDKVKTENSIVSKEPDHEIASSKETSLSTEAISGSEELISEPEENTDESEETSSEQENTTGTKESIDIDEQIYEDEFLMFPMPEGTYFDPECVPFDTAYCYAYPDDDYRSLYYQYYEEELSDDRPVRFFLVSSDSKDSLEFFYDEKITNAQEAANYCYLAYIDTGYTESESKDLGCVGRYTTEVDGQKAYVVWHRGSADLLANMTYYEIFVDSLKGSIVEIEYSESFGNRITNAAETCISSIKFK